MDTVQNGGVNDGRCGLPDGQLQAVQQTQETFLSETETQSVTYALIDGEWVLVEDSN